MTEPTFFQVAGHQRAHRRLLADPVPDADIEAMLGAAVCAPSAQNIQPWEFVVVRDIEQRDRIAAVTRELWESFARDFAKDSVDDVQFADVDQWAMGGIAEAPVLIIVCLDTAKMPVEMGGSSLWPAVQNLLLAAGALGYGSLMANLPTYAGDALNELLGLPDHVTPQATVPIGRPARSLGAPRREPFATHTHRDRWGVSW